MNRIGIICGIIGAAFFSVPSSADAQPTNCTAALSWIAPDQNTDGTPLTDLAGFGIYYGDSPDDLMQNMAVVSDPEQLALLIDMLYDGTTYYFAATAFNDGGLESDFSNVASKDCPAGPEPPSQLTVNGDGFAYVLLQSLNRLALVEVGTVPPGTPCDPEQSINGKHLVDVEAVTFYSPVELRAVVADCTMPQ